MPRDVPASGWGLLLRSLRRQRWRTLASALLLGMWQVCETTVPVVVGRTVDEAIGPGSPTALLTWLGVLVVLFVALSAGYRFGARIGLRATEAERHELRVEVAARSLAPCGVRSGPLPGEVLTIATSDTEKVSELLDLVVHIASSLVAIGIAAFYLFRIDPALGVLVLVGAPVVLALIQVVTPTIWRRWSAQQERIGAASALAADLVRGLRPLKGIRAEDAAGARYRLVSRDAKRASIAAARGYGAQAGVAVTLNGVFLALVAFVAATFAARGELSIGDLIAVVGLAQFLAEPLSSVGEWIGRIAATHASADRIVRFLGAPALVTSGVGDAVPGPPGLRLDGVSCGPLTGLHLATRPGELLGVVAPEPGTTAALLALLRGEIAPDERTGSASLGGVPLAELTIDALRSRLVVNPHHAEVFEGTVRSNLVPRAGGSGDVDAAVRAAAVDEIVAHLPLGLDQPTSAAGTNLSGGQRQRLSLARALVTDAPILVLDDPTTAVDAVTEQRMVAGVRALRRDVTTVVLTSSPAWLAAADRVLLIRDGAVVAEGAHRELVADAGYAETVLR